MSKDAQFGPGTGPWPGTGSPNTGTGGTKVKFFEGLRKQMEKQKWRTLSLPPGFQWAALETEHYDIPTLFAAFDADDRDNLVEGAHLKLSRWADSQQGKMPPTRIALAVFESVPPGQVEYITTELQKGTRMGVQSMTAVVDLKAGRFYAPQEGSGRGDERIRFNKPVLDQLKAVVEVLAAAY